MFLTSKLFNIVFFMVLLIGSVSAAEFDNVRGDLIINDDTSRWGKIEIKEWFGLRKLISLELKENSYACSDNCYAEKEIVLFQDGPLVEDIKFYTIRGKLKTEEDVLSHEFLVYEKGEWVDYSLGEIKREGTYLVRLQAEKDPGKKVDWVIKSQGYWLDEWAVWESSLENGLLSYYKLDGSAGDVLDDIGNNNGTAVGITRGVPGIVQNSIIADGTSSYVNITAFTTPLYNFSSFTVSMWMNRSELSQANSYLIDRRFGTGDAESPFYLRFDGSTDTLNFHTTVQSASENSLVSTAINQNQDYFVVITLDEVTGTKNLYIDNALNITTDVGDNILLENPDVENIILGGFAHPGGAADRDWQGMIDEVGIWNRSLTTTEISLLWNDGNGLTRSALLPSVSVVLDSPPNNTILFNIGSDTFDYYSANITADLGNVSNATLQIWNVTGGLVKTNFTIITGLQNFTNLTLGGLNQGLHFWNYEVCGSNLTQPVNCSVGSNNRTLDIKILRENDFTQSNETTEGNLETFLQNITILGGVTISQADLIYNFTRTSSESFVVGDDVILRNLNFLVPDVTTETNISFFWSVILSNGVNINLTSYNQTVFNLGFDDCSSFTNQVFNFTVFNEETQVTLPNADVEISVNLFNKDRSVSVLNFSQSFGTNPSQVCFNRNLTNSSSYLIDSIVRYEDVGAGAIEFYNIDNFTYNVNTSRQDIRLFDLNLSDSTDFQLTFTGSNFLPVEDALVFVDRQYIAENTFKTVELPKTDANGQTILHLVRNDVIYNIRISKNGAILGNFENIIAFCEDFTIGDCKISLSAFDSTQATFEYDADLGITFTNPSYDNSTNVMSFNFLTTDGSAKTVLMNVERDDIFGNRSICSDTLTSSGGTLSCTANPNLDDTTLRISIFVEGTQVIASSVGIDETDLGQAGYLVFFVMTLTFILMFSGSKTGILFGMALSLIGAIGFGMIKGDLIGFGASGLWLIIIILLGVWKLNKERSQ